MEHGRSEIDRVIEEWVFSERDRKMLRRKLLDGLTYEALAEELGVSVTCVKTRVKRGRGVVLRHLKSE